jgi:hypothetical protein
MQTLGRDSGRKLTSMDATSLSFLKYENYDKFSKYLERDEFLRHFSNYHNFHSLGGAASGVWDFPRDE